MTSHTTNANPTAASDASSDSASTVSSTAALTSPAAFDVAAIRAQFPALHQQIHGHALAYLDNAATSQKPESVIAAVDDYYRHTNANVHRGIHELSQRATEQYEGAREKIATFLNASSSREIVYTRGTTEAINLVAQAYARPRLQPGDEVLITWLEHHSNIVPWQMVCKQTGATLKVVPIDDLGQLDMDAFESLLSERTKFVAAGHVSNALGSINPVKRIVELAHAVGARVLIDGAQSTLHLPVDVQAIGCDFFAFSGHKMYGPTGIGALFGREAILEDMPPYQGGGDMISEVSFSVETKFNDLPHKFEAGTPHIAGGIGLGAAIDWLTNIGVANAAAHEHALLVSATAKLGALPGVKLIGQAAEKASVLSFVIDGMHPSDVGSILDRQGVAIRAGHHCAQPVMERFGLPATARASLAAYNNDEDIDRLVAGVKKAIELFR